MIYLKNSKSDNLNKESVLVAKEGEILLTHTLGLVNYTDLDEITEPIGMEDTGIIASKNGRGNDTTPYAGHLEVHEMDDDLVLSQTYAAGSMYATVEDLYRWKRSIKTQVILNKDLLEDYLRYCQRSLDSDDSVTVLV